MENIEKENVEKESRILFDKNDNKAFMVASNGHLLGYPKCTYILGCCYTDGVGTKINLVKARELFISCFDGLVEEAKENDAVSMGFLGEYYRYGLGTKKASLEEAVKWYTLAANEGIAECKFFLGMLYDDKKNSFYDHEKAYEWYLKAASQGLNEAVTVIKNWKK